MNILIGENRYLKYTLRICAINSGYPLTSLNENMEGLKLVHGEEIRVGLEASIMHNFHNYLITNLARGMNDW